MPGNAVETGEPSSTVRKTRSRPMSKNVNFVEESVSSSDESPHAESTSPGTTDVESISIDPARMGKICEKLKEPDPWPRQFAQSIQRRQEDITKKLKGIKLKSASEKQTFEAAFSPLMKQALQGLSLAPDSDFEPSPSSASGPIHVPFLGAEGQPYCNGLINLMRQSDALIFAYDQLSEWEAQVSRLQNLRAAFEKDKQVAVAMLQAGKRVAEEDIAGLLADKFREVRPAQNLSADDVQTGRLLLARGADVTNTNTSPKQQPLGWGNVARDTERAIEKLCYAGQGHSRKQ